MPTVQATELPKPKNDFETMVRDAMRSDGRARTFKRTAGQDRNRTAWIFMEAMTSVVVSVFSANAPKAVSLLTP